MSEEERLVEVPEFYRKLGEKRDVAYRFDGSPEAWLWKQLLEQSDEACIETAAVIVEAYTELGSYPPSGEDFHHLAEFMGQPQMVHVGRRGGAREIPCRPPPRNRASGARDSRAKAGGRG
jgi:hypothetical protein